MILTCPQCATQYRVDAAKFPAGGRTVRCAKCGHSWHQDAPAEDAAAAPVPRPEPRPAPVFHAPEPEPEPVPPRRAVFVAPAAERIAGPAPEFTSASAPRRGSWLGRIGLAFGWLALVGAVLVIGFAAVTYRALAVQAWPRSASLYAALGMKVNTLGFLDVTHAQETEDGQAVLAIKGKLVNLSGHPIAVPRIEVRLTDSGNREVLRKSFAAGVAELAPGQIATFLARLSSPPAAARHMELRFAAQ
ncbi:MAG TPA: DUF3426 domain-containing protein [Rhizomicrobium sp.]|nr:DUF3426 domain-containing protein [Rhizomicrobium sp.]